MFESADIVTDIKDILQELEDQGFKKANGRLS